MYARHIPDSEGNSGTPIIKNGVYNFSKQKIIYEYGKGDISVWFISYPIFNSVTIILGIANDNSVICIDIVNLLNGHKQRVSYPVKDYLFVLVEDYLRRIQGSIKSRKHKQYIKKLLEQFRIEYPQITEILPLKIHKNYILNVNVDKVVFCKSVTINVNIRYTIQNEDLLVRIYNTLVVRCSIEEGELFVKLLTGKSCRLETQYANVEIDIPSQIFLTQKHTIEMSGNMENSCLYAVSDLFDDYVIIEGELRKLRLNDDDKDYYSNSRETLTKVLRFGNIIIYEISDGNSKRFLFRLMAKPFKKEHKLGAYVIYSSKYELHALDFDKVYNSLTRNQYNYMTKTPQHIDITEQLVKINTWPLIDNSKSISRRLFEGSEGRLHNHKIYFDSRTGDSYLFFSIVNYDPTNGLFSTCIPLYKLRLSDPKAGHIHILTLGPYKHPVRIIPPSKLLPLVTRDIAISNYNILIYPDLLAKLVEGTDLYNNIFIYNNEIKFKFEVSHVAIVDTIYNRRIVFVYDYEPKSTIASVKQDDKILVCLDFNDGEVVYKPFIISEMELVKPIQQSA